MTFTVTYRAKDGALREERVEAANRAECVAECRRRGIAPTGIREGRSGKSAASPKGREGTGDSKRTTARWVAVAVLIIAVAGGVWWWVSARSVIVPYQVPSKPKVEKPKAEKPPKPAAKPAPAPAVTNAPKPKTYKDMTREEKLKTIRDKYGDNIPDNLKPTVYYLENPPQQTFHPARSKYHYLKRSSEREIASVLNIQPGKWMMRAVTFGDKFDKDLAAALGEKIEFEEGDSDEVKAVKQAVIDTKKDLAERIAQGETASEIMNATVKELYTLGQYRRSLEEQVGKIRRNAEYTDDDVRDVVNAANTMLKDKGLPPLRMPNMFVRHASLKRAAERAAAKEASAAKEQPTKDAAANDAGKESNKKQMKLGRGTK